MKMNNGFGRKLRRGSVSLGITALCIAVVLLVNVLASVLLQNRYWFVDLTTEPLYTMSDTCVNLLQSTLDSAQESSDSDEPVVVDIIFCADPDLLIGHEYLRHVYYTALEMQVKFPDHIHVTTTDVWDNPSSVDAYRTNSYSSIYQTNVIIASGTEFRIYNTMDFYIADSVDSEVPWGYKAEKNFLRGIKAVTRAEAPICALTVNHGEPFATEEGKAKYSEFLKVLENAGYDVAFVDLSKEDLPANCRLIITFDPQTDFVSSFMGEGVSEVSKIEKHLADAYSYMVFVDADTPKLPVMEEYLEEWGIAIDRYSTTDANGNKTTGTFEMIDPDFSLNLAGTAVIGQYATTAFGSTLTDDMREKGGSPKVIFGNAVSLSYSPTYRTSYIVPTEENGVTEAFTYGFYNKNGETRNIFDVFSTGAGAYAYAKSNGERIKDAQGEDLIVNTYNPQDPYRLMTITRQSRTIGEDQGYTSVNDSSYVCAIGSTDFASNELLSGNAYGNTDILLSVLRTIGGEVEPVGISWKYLHETAIDTNYYTTAQATVWTVVLALIPALTLSVAGIYVLVRRKIRN
ncbi:MAG: Gldg family protein [Clostridia bacterium]|nr:Gldg family protein [Clostridia bacterium]